MTEVPSKLVIELMSAMTAMPVAAVKRTIREVAMVPHSSAAQIVVFEGRQGTACIWWVDKAGDLRFVRRASWHQRRFVPINALACTERSDSRMIGYSEVNVASYKRGFDFCDTA